MLQRLSQSIVLAWGWRRALLAFLAGASSILALAPVNFWPALFVTFPILVWLIDGASGGRWGGIGVAATTGWWFGFGYFFAGLYWVGNAFLVDPQIFGWLLPFAVTVLPAGLALFTALGVAFARLIWPRGAARVLALAVALTAAEWLRGHVLTGFPWNVFGYALTGPLALAQNAALIGIWGLTFIAIAVFASPATLADDRGDTKRPWLPLALGLVILAAGAIYGTVRLNMTPTAYVANVRLRVMQPNLQQNEKFNYSAKQQVMQRYLALSDRATGPQSKGVQDATHLIWPESAFPFFLTREPDALAQIANLLPSGTVLITGGVRLPEQPDPQRSSAYNSLYVIDHDGSILSVYDKVHLTPFGEYLPLQDFLERLGFMQLTKVRGGFLAGARHRTIDVPGAPPALPLICYEIIFPSEVTPAGKRPGWMLNITNDGWFGVSIGPYQHFQQARVRAIEQGLPLVRAANTGISAVVDPLGRVINSIPLGVEGVFDARLPQAVAPPLYVRYGDGFIALFVAVVFLGVARKRLKRR